MQIRGWVPKSLINGKTEALHVLQVLPAMPSSSLSGSRSDSDKTYVPAAGEVGEDGKPDSLTRATTRSRQHLWNYIANQKDG